MHHVTHWQMDRYTCRSIVQYVDTFQISRTYNRSQIPRNTIPFCHHHSSSIKAIASLRSNEGTNSIHLRGIRSCEPCIFHWSSAGCVHISSKWSNNRIWTGSRKVFQRRVLRCFSHWEITICWDLHMYVHQQSHSNLVLVFQKKACIYIYGITYTTYMNR